MKFPVLGFAVMATVLIAGCGPNLTATPTSPTTTPVQSPFISQFGGFWNGTLTLTRVAGGECVGDDMQADVGTVDVGTVVISQTQTDVTAIIRSASTGLSCRYTGTAGRGAFALHTQACEVNQILFQCDERRVAGARAGWFDGHRDVGKRRCHRNGDHLL